MPVGERRPVVNQQAAGEQARQSLPARIMDGVRRLTGNPPAFLWKAAGVRLMADPPKEEPKKEEKKEEPKVSINKEAIDHFVEQIMPHPAKAPTPEPKTDEKKEEKK